MKKISIVIFLVFSISSQAFAQSACRDLFDRTSAHPTQETMSQTYRDIHELVGSIQNNRVFLIS